jgi:hypothetical protein
MISLVAITVILCTSSIVILVSILAVRSLEKDLIKFSEEKKK